MKALSYLLLRRLKNSVTALVHKPASLILTIVMVALFGVVLLSGSMTRADASGPPRSISELYLILFLLYGLIYFLTALNGLSNGASFFSMADVNMLFVAPLAPRFILNYGLIRQLGTTLMMGLFIPYQYSWLSGVYGIVPLDLLAIILGFALTVFCGQLTAMGLYSFSSGSDGRKRIIRLALYALCLGIILWGVVPVLGADALLPALAERVGGSSFGWIPFAGWSREIAAGLMLGAPMRTLAGLVPTLVFTIGFALLLMRQNADFYEDVLTATEVSHTAITARKEGKAAESTPKNIKLGRTGFSRGWGASAFFYKHLRENRRSRVFILDTTSLIFCIVCIGFAWFMRDNGVVSALVFSCYMMIFSSFTGRWAREMLLPYIYMTPEKPFSKLVSMCGENILKCLVEGIFLFIPIGLIFSLSPVEILACVGVRLSLGLLLIASTILSERLFGAIPVKAVQLVLYFVVIIVLLVPAAIGAGFAAVRWSLELTPILLIMIGWLVLCSAIIGLLCRDILNYAEMNNQ